ncbi:MAG TPA: Na+/H+ antiporter subunit G [Marinobacter hydrocarbonoclasticus]|jgi:multicomponent K+:H+ antiporter subunit G|uniref:Na+/H+ antiporter subunit G n=1 Tax=Marinobacter nauticus TaxID=2743 RepID=A0A350RYH8_MARNT|nr:MULTISPECIES: Na+/H+ antiporter subunit G [Marinobacter]MCG8521962.1 Na+/H+ antiporter subunit G [Pseudomonadales bacterium]MBY6219599.1 Na+/H+ antiporter subunit G [Marinobacter nauticus]MCW9009328.1 Na+/H+ antiporter subunit G [Marinobacter sp.]RKR77737.1 multisubunit potassium/proton antiporter PhaG subunit [Marinobacter nauticus]HAC27913.1 Na+/H+ antiporter subunit G [Marinobacter nauticus]|tara:strand:- start:788 stop:1120 length:333 start_codon:yes stop_codon:yes gene_type:complete
MSTFAEYAISAMLIIGGVFTLIGAIGLARLPDFYTRLHGPTKATTVGVGAIVISSVIYFSTLGRGIGIEEILITAFLFMTAPISANFLAKAAMHLEVRTSEKTRGQTWDQ